MKKKEQLRRARAKAQMQAERASSGEPKAEKAKATRAKGAKPGTEEFKHEQTVKTTFWNRYMLLRYLDAGLFFLGLYWAIMVIAVKPGIALLLPVLEIAISAAVFLEILSVLSREIEYLKWSHRLLGVSLATSAAAMVTTLIVGPGHLFPFFNSATPAVVLCMGLMAVKGIMIWRICQVRDHKDKRYELYQKVLKYN